MEEEVSTTRLEVDRNFNLED